MSIVQINNVRLIDPIRQIDQHLNNVYLKNGHLIAAPDASNEISEQIDGNGQWLMPAMVDLCAQLREPGQQQHGTLKSEGTAAKNNGFLHIFTPPDSQPIVQDNGALIAGLQQKAWLDAGVYLYIIGAQTKALAGEQPSNMAALKKGGCIAVSNAYAPFASDDVVLATLEYATSLGLTVFFYPEEASLAGKGCVHDGFTAQRLGLPTIPKLAETVALSKYLLMVETVGATAHFGLLSCAQSITLITQAKQRGVKVTADVAMHQLHLTDELIDGFNVLAHVRPPLRSEDDRDALRQGIKSGAIDAICSHHEPLNHSAKLAPFPQTAAGITAFDTFLSLGLSLVNQQVITALELSSLVSKNPARIGGIEQTWQQKGGWFLFDSTQQWQVTQANIDSQGKNTPYLNSTLLGKVCRLFY